MPNAPSPEMVATRDGTRLAVHRWRTESDTGSAVVLVHGLASNARLWDAAARKLATRGHAVVAVDLRGHGLSDTPDHGYDVPSVAHDVVDVIGHLAREWSWPTPVVAGQSWGGNVVVQLAASHVASVRGVVAVDGGTIDLSRAFPVWDDCAVALAPPRLEGVRADRLRAAIASSHPDWSDEALDGTMHNMEVLADGTVRPRLTRERHMTILRHLWEHSPTSLWPTIEVPVLFTPAVGDDARGPVKREHVEKAVAELRVGAVEWFEGADHDLHAQHPGRFADVVHRHLTEGIFS